MVTRGWDMKTHLKRHDVVYTATPSEITDALPFGNGRFGGLVHRPDAWEWTVAKLDVDMDFHRDYKKHPDASRYRTWELVAEAGPEYDALREAVRRKDADAIAELTSGRAKVLERERKVVDSAQRLPAWYAGEIIPAWLRVHTRGAQGAIKERLDLYGGRITASCEDDGRRYRMETVVDPDADVYAVSLEATKGALPLEAIELLRPPHDAFNEIRPRYGRSGDCLWVDFAFANHFRYAVALRIDGPAMTARKAPDGMAASFKGAPKHVTLYVSCVTMRETDNPRAAALETVRNADVSAMRPANRKRWKRFWSESAVEIGDDILENVYYFHQYAFACTHGRGLLAKYKGAGLYGLWTHSDHITWSNRPYLDVNIEEAYQHALASNHLDFYEPFIDLIHTMLPAANLRSRKKYGVEEGAAFYGGWQCAGPWLAILLWERYLHDLDLELLRERIYPVMRAVGLFGERLVEEDEDGTLYFFGSAPPERGNLTDGKKDAIGFGCLFRDVAIDLAFFKYLYKALVEATDVLGVDKEHAQRWKAILDRFPDYPTVDTPHGKAIVDVAEYDSPHLCHHPNVLAPLYPSRELHLASPKKERELGEATVRSCWDNIAMIYTFNTPWVATAFARMGLSDEAYAVLDQWIVDGFLTPAGFVGREVNEPYRPYFRLMQGPLPGLPPLLETGCCTIAAVNEMLLQQHDGELFVFPAVPDSWADARFRDLRAPGAFVVSAERIGGRVARVTILAEKGGRVRIRNPWKGEAVLQKCGTDDIRVDASGRTLSVRLAEGETVTFKPANASGLRRSRCPKSVGPKVKHSHRDFHRFIGMDPDTRVTQRIERFAATIYTIAPPKIVDPEAPGSNRELREIRRNLYFLIDAGGKGDRMSPRVLYTPPDAKISSTALDQVWLPLGRDTEYDNSWRYGWIHAPAVQRTTQRRGHPLVRAMLSGTREATLRFRLDEGSYEVMLIHGGSEGSRTRVSVPSCGVEAVFDAPDAEPHADAFGVHIDRERRVDLVFSTDRGRAWRLGAILVKRVW